MAKIQNIKAREILDSRGMPTVEADVTLDDGSFGRAAVPSGASVGTKEAIELRDEDNKRFLGKGVLKAVGHVNGEIAKNLEGVEAGNQEKIDDLLIDLDGTDNKSRLGANAILAASLAVAKASAASLDKPLFEYFGDKESTILPVPLINIINGGAHADNSIDFQEFMIAPVSADNFRESVRMGSEIFHSLKVILNKSGHSTNVGDEGGFAPNLRGSEEVLEFILESIEQAGYKAGEDILLALDAAASEFYEDGFYHLKSENLKLDSDELVDYYDKLISQYPIISLEDPMSEHDHNGWASITDSLGEGMQIVGDDIFVTNEKILQDGIENHLANAILIKPNQIGTLTETFRTIELAHDNDYACIISHRSGETSDSIIAHIAVACGCGQIKTGSMSRSDRLAKYNELIRIEELLGSKATYAGKAYR